MIEQEACEKAAFIISRIDEYMPENVNPHYWIKVGFDIAYQQALKDYFTLIGCTDEHK